MPFNPDPGTLTPEPRPLIPDPWPLPWLPTLPTTCRSTPAQKSTMRWRSAPSASIGPHVRIGRGTRLENSVTLMGHVILGEFNHVYPGRGDRRRAAGRQLLPAATPRWSSATTTSSASASPSTAAPKRKTASPRIGDHNFLMACCHVAHDCQLGNHIILANGTLLGGHVHVHDHAILSGGVGRAPLRHDRQLQLRRRPELRAPRRAALHARRGLSRPAALHQRRRH